MKLATSRLLIRPWTPDDANAAFAIYGDPRVMRFLGPGGATGGSPPVPNLATMRASLEKRAALPATPDGLPGMVAFCLHETDEPIGSVLLKRLPDAAGKPTPETELGWHLRPDCWGHGYATEAARAWFAVLNLHAIFAVVYAQNTASIRLTRRLGMTPKGSTDKYYGVTLEHFRLDRHTK